MKAALFCPAAELAESSPIQSMFQPKRLHQTEYTDRLLEPDFRLIPNSDLYTPEWYRYYHTKPPAHWKVPFTLEIF